MNGWLDLRETEMGIICDGPQCTCQAAYVVTYHRLDHCKNKPVSVLLFCAACSEKFCGTVTQRIKEMRANVEQLTCDGCGMKIRHTCDILGIERLIPTRTT